MDQKLGEGGVHKTATGMSRVLFASAEHRVFFKVVCEVLVLRLHCFSYLKNLGRGLTTELFCKFVLVLLFLFPQREFYRFQA